MIRWIVTFLVSMALWGCSQGGTAGAEHDRQSEKYWEQAGITDQQLAVMAEQNQRVEEQQKFG